jgi:hypothetical protein
MIRKLPTSTPNQRLLVYLLALEELYVDNYWKYKEGSIWCSYYHLGLCTRLFYLCSGLDCSISCTLGDIFPEMDVYYKWDSVQRFPKIKYRNLYNCDRKGWRRKVLIEIIAQIQNKNKLTA